MSGYLAELQVGDVVPACPIPLRSDGTCTPGVHVADPLHLDVILGVDVAPEQEQAIMDACQEITTDGASRKRLWVWSIEPNMIGPLLSLTLLLRPAATQWRHMHWMLHYATHDLCSQHAEEIAEDAHSMAGAISDARCTKGLHARILLVGRDHRLLGISHAACHGEISYVWMVHLFSGCARRLDPEHAGPPPVPMGIMTHISGMPQTMVPREARAWLGANGWTETVEQVRLRRRRQKARRRAGA